MVVGVGLPSEYKQADFFVIHVSVNSDHEGFQES